MCESHLWATRAQLFVFVQPCTGPACRKSRDAEPVLLEESGLDSALVYGARRYEATLASELREGAGPLRRECKSSQALIAKEKTQIEMSAGIFPTVYLARRRCLLTR